MKQNIIIAGVPRAGKSTIAHLISQQYGYQHVSMDAIIAGFERNFPQLGVNTYANMPSFDILHTISGKIAPFINTMMDSGEYDEFDRGMVLDIYQLIPADFVRYIDQSFCRIFYFVTAAVSAEERFAILKAHDTPHDYSYYKSEDELRNNCLTIVEQSVYIRDECHKYHLPCYETSQNREQVIEQFLSSLFAPSP